MATAVTPTNIQKLEFDVTTAEGPSRITIVAGSLPVGLTASAAGMLSVTQNISATALIDPNLTPGQFRRSIATAALGAMSNTNAAAAPCRFSIDEVRASFDDESGRIELRVDASATALNGSVSLQSITFQVTTLSKL